MQPTTHAKIERSPAARQFRAAWFCVGARVFAWMLMALAMMAGRAAADDQTTAAQVAAARSDALEALRREILSTQMLPDATVQTLVDRAAGQGTISKVLATAQQLGGPRWIDEQTCQVTLTIEGDVLADALVDLAQSKPKAITTPPATLRDKLRRWKHRSFSAVGTSLGWSAVDRLRPDPAQGAWQTVNDDERRKAIGAARQTAVTVVLDSLKLVPLEASKTLGDALAVPQVEQELRTWLGARPVTAVQFRDNLEVRLALSVAPQELWPILKEAIGRQKTVPLPSKTADWVRVREQMVAKMAPPVGTATAVAGHGGAPMRAAVFVPAMPPAWVNESLEAEASVRGPGSALRTARAAETAACEQLRAKLNALALNPGQTLGDAAHLDPRIEAALARSVREARVVKVDYDSPTPGSVKTKVSMNLEDVWRDIASR